MTLTYDSSIRFGVLSPSAWVESPARRWFPNTTIFAQDMGRYNVPLGVESGIYDENHVSKINTLLDSPLAVQYKARHFPNLPILLNKPRQTNMSPVICNSLELFDQFSDKVRIRELLPEQPFAPWRAVAVEALSIGGLFSLGLGAQLVVQEALSSGGSGTYFVDDEKSAADCLAVLRSKNVSGRVLISQRLADIKELTVQACVAQGQVYVGPLQEQLVRHPLLASGVNDAMQFCGGRISPGFYEEYYDTVHKIATKIGEGMRDAGYRGIFGIDFALSQGELYVIEVNARKTGLTPLVSSISDAPPMYAMHCLELLRYPYTYTGTVRGNVIREGGSFVQVYAQKDGVAHMESGLYTYDGKRIGDGFEDASLLPREKGCCFVAIRHPVGRAYAKGKSLAFIYSRDELFNGDIVVNRVRQLVELVRA